MCTFVDPSQIENSYLLYLSSFNTLHVHISDTFNSVKYNISCVVNLVDSNTHAIRRENVKNTIVTFYFQDIADLKQFDVYTERTI